VIDEMVGAELFCLLQFLIGAGSGDDARAEEFGNLNGGGANAATCPKDKNIFAGLQLGSGKKHVPGGLEDKRNRGGLFKGQVSGYGRQFTSGARTNSAQPPSIK